MEHYRAHTGKTWIEVAKKLAIGVSALMMVKSGKRGMSPKVIYRLAQAEIEAGIEAPVTGKTTLGEMAELTQRTQQPATDFMDDATRQRLVARLRASVTRNEETIALLQDSIRLDREELQRLEGKGVGSSDSHPPIPSTNPADHPVVRANEERVKREFWARKMKERAAASSPAETAPGYSQTDPAKKAAT